MKRFAYDIFMIVVILILIAAGIYGAWGPVPPIPARSEPNVQELQAEIARLAPYEEFMKQTNVVITYNGCEDIRKRLGLTTGVGRTP